jgi:hypothetical protein
MRVEEDKIAYMRMGELDLCWQIEDIWWGKDLVEALTGGMYQCMDISLELCRGRWRWS